MRDPFLLVSCGQLPLPLLPSLQTSKRPNPAHVTWPTPGLDTEGSDFFLVHVDILQWTLAVSKLGKVMSSTKFAQCDKGVNISCWITCFMTVSQPSKLWSLPRMRNVVFSKLNVHVLYLHTYNNLKSKTRCFGIRCVGK